jgi:hypothetical protein
MMTLPNFTAEDSIGAPRGHYGGLRSPVDPVQSTIAMAQFMPGVATGPMVGFDLPINWEKYEVAGATEVLCDDRCLRACYAQIRSACQHDANPALCFEETRRICRPKCCMR